MAVVQLADIIQPQFFSEYMAQNSMVSTALFQSGVLVPNSLMDAQLQGASIRSLRCWAAALAAHSWAYIVPEFVRKD